MAVDGSARPLRFVQLVVVALASAGLVALASRQLLGYQQIPSEMGTPVVTWLAPITAVLMLTLPAALVASRPAMGAAGGSPIVAAGVGVGTLVAQVLPGGTSGETALLWTLALVAGFALAVGGVLVAAARAAVAERIAVAGLILVWFAYRRGKADLARWVVLGFALGGPSLVLLLGRYFGNEAYGGEGWWTTHGLAVALATAAGVVLTRSADWLFAWDALGVIVAAVGMIISSVSYRIGPSTSETAYLLIVGGFAFALASGLARVLKATGESAGAVAVSLSLGLVALLTTADAIAPAAWLLASSNGFEGFRLSVPVTSLVAAAVLLALFGFRRAVDRFRRELREQAAEQEPPG